MASKENEGGAPSSKGGYNRGAHAPSGVVDPAEENTKPYIKPLHEEPETSLFRGAGVRAGRGERKNNIIYSSISSITTIDCHVRADMAHALTWHLGPVWDSCLHLCRQHIPEGDSRCACVARGYTRWCHIVRSRSRMREVTSCIIELCKLVNIV